MQIYAAVLAASLSFSVVIVMLLFAGWLQHHIDRLERDARALSSLHQGGQKDG